MKETNYDYETIMKIGRQYYNDTNFCTVVALAVTARIGFGKAFHTYRRLGRRTRSGTRQPMQHEAFKQHGLGLTPDPIAANTLGATLRTVANNAYRLKGTYLVYSRAHVSAIVDGKMIDWAAPSEQKKGSLKRVLQVFKVEPIL